MVCNGQKFEYIQSCYTRDTVIIDAKCLVCTVSHRAIPSLSCTGEQDEDADQAQVASNKTKIEVLKSEDPAQIRIFTMLKLIKHSDSALYKEKLADCCHIDEFDDSSNYVSDSDSIQDGQCHTKAEISTGNPASIPSIKTPSKTGMWFHRTAKLFNELQDTSEMAKVELTVLEAIYYDSFAFFQSIFDPNNNLKLKLDEISYKYKTDSCYKYTVPELSVIVKAEIKDRIHTYKYNSMSAFQLAVASEKTNACHAMLLYGIGDATEHRETDNRPLLFSSLESTDMIDLLVEYGANLYETYEGVKVEDYINTHPKVAKHILNIKKQVC